MHGRIATWLRRHGRHRALGEAEARFYRAILRACPELGAPPDAAWLTARAARLGVAPEATLRTLVARGLIARDAATGALLTALPFSAVPTAHVVELVGARPVYAACAVDALGIPLLLGRDATMRSRDPVSGAPIRIAVRAGAARWDPPSAVVYSCDPRRAAAGPEPCCGAIHFFATPESAGAYLRAHAGPGGRVLAPAAALAVARRQFGDLLAGAGPLACCCR